MSGASNWEVSQLVKVIDSIDMRMSDFFDIYNYAINEVHDAIWNDGKNNVKCKIYLSNVNAIDTTEYSALKINDEWVVFHTNDIKDDVFLNQNATLK